VDKAETGDGHRLPFYRSSPRWWPWLRLILLGLAMAGVAGWVMTSPLLPRGQVVLGVGDIATRDVRAPRQISYESSILTSQAQDAAAADVEPVYTSPDPELARQQLDRAREVLDYLGSVRADPLASPARKRAWARAVPELEDLSVEMLEALVSLSDESWDRVQLETLAVIDQAMRREIREGFLGQALEDITALVSLDLTQEEAQVTEALVRQFLLPNAYLDEEATAASRERAREQVPSVLRTFEEGEIIVREGQRVGQLDVEAMDQLGLRQARTRWLDYVGAGLLAGLSTALMCLYLARFESSVLWDGPQLLLMTLLITLFTLVAGVMIPAGEALRYLYPAPALAVLATATLGAPAGTASALFVGIVTATIADEAPLEMMSYVALGGVAATLTLGRVERIAALFRAGAFALLVHVVVVVAFGFVQRGGLLVDMAIPAVAGIINGGVSASLALGGLFLIGPLFDIPTTMRLIELSRPDYPLLQRLLREAPATYHHSLMVANMAEQAAERIGADALLTRVGAYYHDVGKIARPYFFTENQVEGVNPHDRLDPKTSAEVIVGHVKDGIDLARRYRVPSRVRAFIPEHHGTNWVSFLYKKALEEAEDPSTVDEDDFRHIGPKPQSKETALVMLADGCEAAVRSARPATIEELESIVGKVFTQRMEDGQLDESNLTMRDLHLTQAAFVSALKGVFHPRIKYPESDSERNGERSDAP